jgi:hypothetical protein
MSAKPNDIKRGIEEAGIPLRELGAISGLNYQRICNWKKGWTELKEAEIAALREALTSAIRARIEKFNQMLNQIGGNGDGTQQ